MQDLGGALDLRSCLEYLKACDIRNAVPETDLDHLTRLATRLLDVPIGMIILSNSREKVLLCCIGLEDFTLPSTGTFGDETLRQRATMVVPDARTDPRFANSALVAEPFSIYFYAGTPLIDSTGAILGTLCLMDRRARPTLDAAQIRLLEDLAQVISDRIELRLRNREAHETARRAAMRGEMLQLILEAPDFDTACTTALAFLREQTNALYCRLFSLTADGIRVRYVAGTALDDSSAAAVCQTMRAQTLTIQNTLAARSIVAGEQAVLPDISRLQQGPFEMDRVGLQPGPVSLIATPFAMLDEQHVLCVALAYSEADPTRAAEVARIAVEVTEVLRPVLRRRKDEMAARLFMRAVECSPDPVLICDAEAGTRIQYCNQAFLNDTGYRMEDILGRSPRFLQGPATEPEARATLRAAIDTWQPVRQVILNYKADGTPFHCELNIAPVADHTGWYTHWVGVQRNVTVQMADDAKRRASLREMQALFNSIPGAIIRYGGNLLRRLFVSPPIETLTGYTDKEAMEIGWMRARMRPEDYVEMIAHVQQAVETGSSTVEFRFRHRDGSLRMIQSRMCSFTDADGNTEVLSIWIDMTRERTLANQLDQAAKLADLGALAAGLAHELNNPLAAIMLTAENAINVIENLPDPPTRVASKLATICELATRAAQLIRHVQLFSRFDNGQYMPVALEALLADMMVLARAKLMQSNVSVLIDTPADLPPVLARPVALEQVLINLVTNACDAYRLAIPKISSIHRKVWIESRQVDGWVVLDVRDQAGGVPEQYLPHLFSSFFTTKPAGEGTGLGLSISARIATEMGGTLSVINQNGGATFTLRLPMLAD